MTTMSTNVQKVGLGKKISTFWNLLVPYWRSEDKYKAWGMLFLVISINVVFVYLSVLLNEWSVAFYNSLQTLNKELFITQCYKFMGLVGLLISAFVSTRYFTNLLAFRWRTWLTNQYLNRWLNYNMHYRLSLESRKTDNPDQRISQDLASFSTGVLSLAVSIFKETINFFTFIVILWGLSGPLHIPLGEKLSFTIPAYIVWAVLLYALLGTYIVFKIGKPVIQLDFDQERFEANFRYHLIRLRERSEEIALYKGESAEALNFRNAFQAIMNNFRKIVNRNVYINAWQNFYLNFSTLFPILAAAPLFFSGAMTFGVLMQLRGAFVEVKDSLSILIMDYQTIAQLVATTNRIEGFSAVMQEVENKHGLNGGKNDDKNDNTNNKIDNKTETLLHSKSHTHDHEQGHLQAHDHPYDHSHDHAHDRVQDYTQNEDIQKQKNIILNETANDTLSLENVSLHTPSGNCLIENLNLTIHPGERVLLMGASGLGKSTLTRAIAGVWPFGAGCIHLPASASSSLFIVPQRPYMPIGTLRQGLLYPSLDFSKAPLSVSKSISESTSESTSESISESTPEAISTPEPISEETLIEILTACRLDHLHPYLDEARDWGLQLSLGEQQRIIFARALIRKPSWLIMDEPTASMDKQTEARVYHLLHQHLPTATIITIGHSPTLKAFHSRVIELDYPEVLDEERKLA